MRNVAQILDIDHIVPGGTGYPQVFFGAENLLLSDIFPVVCRRVHALETHE